MTENRFDRSEKLFGKKGQDRIRKTRIAVMGAGGLGSFVVMETALLGFGHIDVVDCECLSLSNRNRYVGARHSDPIPGSRKVELAVRHINLIDPEITAKPIHANILSSDAINAIKDADFVMGCVDNDGVRFFLNEACLAYRKPLIDMASGVPEPGVFGGHVVIVTGDCGCLDCLDILDKKEVRQFQLTPEMRENENAIYGVKHADLDEVGPSVAPMNGVVASLGVTALMALATGMSLPYKKLTYYGDSGKMHKKPWQKDPVSEQCYYCVNVQGQGGSANLERYFNKR